MTNLNFDQEDKNLQNQYIQENPWGLSTSVDLKDCDPEVIRSSEKITQFVDELCKLIDMKKFGPTTVVNFGDNPRVNGFSMTQLIETSLISGHFANQTNSAYLDIFSCKSYPPYKMAQFCQTYFKAKSLKVEVNFRH